MSHLWVFAPAALLLACMAFGSRVHLVAAALLTLWLYVGLVDNLGRAKPARVEMLATLDRAEVLWFAGSEADGISIVLAGPRLYGLPWSAQTMRALHEASQAVEGRGGTVILRRGADGAEGGEWSAEHVPAPEPAPKN